MSEKAVQQIFQGMNVKEMHSNGSLNTSWVVKEDDIGDSTSIGSMSEDSMNSECSTYFSSELAEEEVSSSTSYLSSSSSSSNISNGPLYELSDLITHLPIKRGLSMFYQGKAQSFTSLARVQSIEDLAKKGKPNYRKKMKSCKSYGGGLDSSHRISYPPKATISKKASRGSSFVSVPSKRESLLGGTRPSVAVVHKNF